MGVAEGLPEVGGDGVEEGDAGGAERSGDKDRFGKGALTGEGDHAVVGTGEIRPVVFGTKGGGAIGPEEEVFGTLREGRGGFEGEVGGIAGGDPGDDGEFTLAGTAEDGGLKTHELEPFPGVTGAVHVLEPHPVFNADQVEGAATTEIEPVESERGGTPAGLGPMPMPRPVPAK